MEEPKKQNIFTKTYEEKYKKLMLLPIIFLIFSLCMLGFWKINTGEFISKDISLKGGYLVTIQTSEQLDIPLIETNLKQELDLSLSVKELRSISGGRIGYSFEVEPSDIETIKAAIEKVTNIKLTEDNYAIEEISTGLGEAFWNSTMKAIALAFIFMAIVIFYYFRKPLISGSIILAVMSNIIGVLALINLFDIKLSTAGVAAILMLIGYSVDSNILLTTKLIKRREGTELERLFGAIKTGLTMEITTLVSLSVIFIVSPALMLKQIALILIMGLLLDFMNTWIMNAGILRIYLEKKHE